MENLTQKTVPTFESVWASLQETGKLLQETRENIEKSRVDYERRSAEFDRKMEESRVNFEKSRAEYEQKRAESNADFERKRAESNADFERKRAESNADFERRMEKSRADSDRRMKKMEESIGSWANNHGLFAEEYFVNSFENGKQNFFGERFDRIEDRVKGIKKGFGDEYDILLINGKSIGIVEVKFKAHVNDIPKVLRKAETFRINFAEYANHRVYLGLATMVFYPELEQECINQGIAVIKQVGDTVVINDAHLKAF